MSDLDRLRAQLGDPSGLGWNEETYDLALARGLSSADRATYVAELIALARKGDTRAILTLGNLPAPEALSILRADGTSDRPWAQAARRGLVLLGCGAEVVDAIARDAVRGPAKMGRVAAVLDLGTLGGPIALDALEQALADEDDTVRVLAWDGLVAALGLAPHLCGPDGKRDLSTELELLRVFLSSELQAFVKIGVEEMRALVAQLKAGATPHSLGISWSRATAPDTFVQLRVALYTDGAPLPIAEVAALGGVERRWAEAMIALRLDTRDPRLAAALAQLGATWAEPVVAEVSATSKS